ncbi:MAG: FtsH protease activity modulator HflK [Clostridia bacterium]|nr:FtsH protease activity modulator HflK [Clostridia bacterium]MBR5265251.1 FtsH protease activity modulator HflK [Clostridia bacterium]
MSEYNPFDEGKDDFSPPQKPQRNPIDIKAAMKKVRNAMIILLVLVLCITTAYSGAYVLESGKVAVITTFGQYTNTETESGLKVMIPFVQKRYIVDTANVRRMEFGYRGDANVDVPEESTMLTGDECLVVADWTIQYNISDGYAWLFNLDNPENTLRIIAESSYRRVVASHSLDDILTDKKDEIQREVMEDLQEVCNYYDMGVKINAVQLQDAMPPDPVYDAFLDVTSAKEDKNAKINEAQKYANEKLPVARGEAESLLKEAEAYKEERINEAIGDTARYSAIAKEYLNQPEVTRTRLYLEMINEVLPNLREIYITDDNGDTLQFIPIGGAQ